MAVAPAPGNRSGHVLRGRRVPPRGRERRRRRPEGRLGPAHDGRPGHVALRDQQPQGRSHAVRPDVVPPVGAGPRTIRRAKGGGKSGPDEPAPPARVERRPRRPDDPLGCPRVLLVPGGGQEDLPSSRRASRSLPVRPQRWARESERRDGVASRCRDALGRTGTECPIRRRCGTPPRGRPSGRGTFFMKIEHCEFPDDLLYDPEGLVWARPLESGGVIVGITSILAALAGPVMKVAAKPLGVPYARGATVGLLESGKYFGPIRAPISGVLREVNAAVLVKPRTLTDASYDYGWFARLQPTNFKEERRGLRSAMDARGSLSKQIAALRVRCFAAFVVRSHHPMGPGKRTARPTIFPSRRSLRPSAASASGAFRVTTGRRRPASASEIARAKSAIVEEYAPRYAFPPSTRSFAVTWTASDPGATATNRPPGPSSERPRSNVPFVPTKSMATSAPASFAKSRNATPASSGPTARSAPQSRAAFRASTLGSIAKTRALYAFETWMAERPTPPAPMMTTISSSSACPKTTTAR